MKSHKNMTVKFLPYLDDGIIDLVKNASKMAKTLSGKGGKDMQKMMAQMGGAGGMPQIPR
jgi:hypothetical protein